MDKEDKQEILSVLADAKKYIKYAHDDAESRHDTHGIDYMSTPLYEIMRGTEKLLERIDSIITESATDSDSLRRRCTGNCRRLIAIP